MILALLRAAVAILLAHLERVFMPLGLMLAVIAVVGPALLNACDGRCACRAWCRLKSKHRLR
jgi:hypothetical protein